MAHFAKIEDNLVTQVIVVDNSDILDESNNDALTRTTWQPTTYVK